MSDSAPAIKSIEIIWLEDEYYCDDCGWSLASGAEILVNGVTAVSMNPSAHCTGGTDYPSERVFRVLLTYLATKIGFTYTETDR